MLVTVQLGGVDLRTSQLDPATVLEIEDAILASHDAIRGRPRGEGPFATIPVDVIGKPVPGWQDSS